MKPFRLHNGECLKRKRRANFVLTNPRHKRYIGASNRQRLIGLKIANSLAWTLIFAGDE